MAYRIEIKGPAKYLVILVVAPVFLGNWLVPDLVAGVTGQGGRSWRLLRSGHLDRYYNNLTSHWMTAESGTTKAGRFFAFAGEHVILDYGVTRREGGLGIRLGHYDWSIVPATVWGTTIRGTQEQVVRIEVPETGIYDVRLSYLAFSGDVRLDWSVE